MGSTPLILLSSFIYALYIFNFLEILFQPFLLKIYFITPSLVEEGFEDIIMLRIKNNSFINKNFQILWEKNILGEVKRWEEKEFLLRYIFRKRGIQKFKGVYLKFSGSLGLLYIKRFFQTDSKTLVYPKFYHIFKELTLSKDFGENISTSTLAVKGDEIHSLRKYNPSDPLRIIAWKASAKKGELISKQFEKTFKSEPIFLLDNIIPKIDEISLEEFDQLLRFLHSFVLPYLKLGLRIRIKTLYPYDTFIPQNWDELKIFLAQIELIEGIKRRFDEYFDLIFSLDYNFWIDIGLQNRLLGVEFHSEKFKNYIFIFKKDDNPYEFLNFWGIRNE